MSLNAPGGPSPARPHLFIADLHLGEARPDLTRYFLAFLRGPAREAASLYILGDLFEYWAGDDDQDEGINKVVVNALSELTASGTALFFLPGNRDFLIGEAWAQRTGAQRLEDPCALTLDGRPLLLSHGDGWCTDDVAYQHFKLMVRNPAWQAAFLARPLAERRKIIESMRVQSEQAKQDKTGDIMDVNDEAIAQALRAHDYPTVIHGHTHRPGTSFHQVDDRSCERWVLSDWRDCAPYLLLEQGQLRYQQFRPGH